MRVIEQKTHDDVIDLGFPIGNGHECGSFLPLRVNRVGELWMAKRARPCSPIAMHARAIADLNQRIASARVLTGYDVPTA